MTTIPRRGYWSWLLVGLVVIGAGSCGREGSPAADSGDADAGEDLAEAPEGSTHLVRGIVVDLPRKESPASDFTLHHEAIPAFKRMDGSLGMASMSMPFTSERPFDLSHVKIGDKVEMTWVSWWEKTDRGMRLHTIIENVIVLDPATELDFDG